MISLATLRGFCAHRLSEKHWQHEPFRIDDHAYATNGHIVVRVPLQPRWELCIAQRDVQTAIERLFGMYFGDFTVEGMPEPLPELGPVDPCHGCKGRGWIHRDELCDDCYGTGADMKARTSIGGVLFARAYLAQIRALPAHRFLARRIPLPSLFWFAGDGCGLLMPIKTIVVAP